MYIYFIYMLSLYIIHKQGAKTGGITSGYPVRAPQPPPAPYPPPPPGTYVSASGANVPGRLLYTQPGARYLQREV